MLVLTRKIGERIHISGGITITLVEVRGQKVRLGVEAPPTVGVLREELLVREGRGRLATSPRSEERPGPLAVSRGRRLTRPARARSPAPG
jgi:carbon storage regulator